MEKPQINVREIIRKLPEDLVRYILPFTYSYQTPELIEDIRSFYRYKEIVKDHYRHKWSIYLTNSPFEDVEWMSNDIIIYANSDQATMHGYHPFFYHICSRSFSLDSQEKQHQFIQAILQTRVKPMKCFNAIWGLLIPEERQAFIRKFVFLFGF